MTEAKPVRWTANRQAALEAVAAGQIRKYLGYSGETRYTDPVDTSSARQVPYRWLLENEFMTFGARSLQATPMILTPAGQARLDQTATSSNGDTP